MQWLCMVQAITGSSNMHVHASQLRMVVDLANLIVVAAKCHNDHILF